MNARPDPPARELDRLVELAGLGPATLAEFGPELARLAAELEAAFGPEAGLADEIPHRAMGLSDLREDQARERHRAGLWLAEAPERTGDLLRVPPAMGRGEAEGPGPVGPSAAAPAPEASPGLDPWNALVAEREPGPAGDGLLAGLAFAVKANLA